MRLILLGTMVGAAGFASGCNADCGSPQALNGQVFKVFANEVERLRDEGGEVFAAGPDYLSYGSPANGESKWIIDWGDSAFGPLTVTIDGQAFKGDGDMDLVECGQFDISVPTEGQSAEYVSEDGVIHTFQMFGVLVYSADELRGELEWHEGWISADASSSGTYHAIVAIQGEL